MQDFAGRLPQDLAAALRALVFNANQDPALTGVFSTYAANVPQLFLDIDRDKAEALSVPVAEIFSVLQANLGSSCVNDFNLFGKVYRVIIQAEARYRNTVEDIGRLHVRNAAGDMIPLGLKIPFARLANRTRSPSESLVGGHPTELGRPTGVTVSRWRRTPRREEVRPDRSWRLPVLRTSRASILERFMLLRVGRGGPVARVNLAGRQERVPPAQLLRHHHIFADEAIQIRVHVVVPADARRPGTVRRSGIPDVQRRLGTAVRPHVGGSISMPPEAVAGPQRHSTPMSR